MRKQRKQEVDNGVLIQEFFDWPDARRDLPVHVPRSVGGKKAEARVPPGKEAIPGQPLFISNNTPHIKYSDRFRLNGKIYNIMMTRLRSLVKALKNLEKNPGEQLKKKFLSQREEFFQKYKAFCGDMIIVSKTSYNQIVPFFNMGKLMGRADRAKFLDFIDKVLILHGIEAPAVGYGEASKQRQKTKRYVFSLFKKGRSIKGIVKILDENEEYYLKKDPSGKPCLIKQNTLYSWRKEWRKKNIK